MAFPPIWLVNGLVWVQTTTGFPNFVNRHGWMWAGGEVLHFIGLCLLMGTIGAFDLRLLGMARGLAMGPLTRLLPWGVLGFVICMLTGAFFVFGNHWSANAYLNNIAFKWKMSMILLAGVNVLAFKLSGLERAVKGLGGGASAPFGAKVVAAASLVIWVSVIFWGRFLPILGDAF